MDETSAPSSGASPEDSAIGGNAPQPGASADDTARLTTALIDQLSHDLRSPLGAILLWTRVLRQAPAGQADVTNALDMIERSATKMVADLDAFADTRAAVLGECALPREPLDFEALVARAAQHLGDVAEARDVSLEIGPSAGAPFVSANPRRLQEAIVRALTSVLLDVPHGRCLTICTREAGEAVECRFVLDAASGDRGAVPASRRAALEERLASRLLQLEGGSLLRDDEDAGTLTIRVPRLAPAP